MGLFSGSGFLGSVGDTVRDFDLGETAETVKETANTAQEIDQILDPPDPTTPPIRSPGGGFRDPDPQPDDPQPDPQPGRTFAGMGQTTILMLGLAGAFIVTQS